ncbi:MAG TPA: acylphosphatase [Gemmatimonadaceae bacterium]|nr:acylphosphatase [Gemmatimonadaceae bacterium]
MARVHLEIVGRVQGVGYRWFAREQARRLGVAGWVRNRDDGSVEVTASGPDELVASLVEELRAGPPGARIDGIRQLADPGGDLPHPFSIVK